MAQQGDEEKITEAVQKILDEGDKELETAVKKKMKETFSEYPEEKINEYTKNLLKWDNHFDSKHIDPGRIITGWIEVILKIKKIKKELKKEKDLEKKEKLIKEKMRKEFLSEFKKEFIENEKDEKKKLLENDIKEITDEVFKWHNDVLGKDVTKFVKAWVEVESTLQPIRDKIEAKRDKQEDIEYEIEKKKAEAEAAKKREEDRIKWESEREQRKKEAEEKRKKEEEKRKKEEEERKAREEYERKPKFYSIPKGKTSKLVIIKTSEKLTDYLKKTKGTQFVVMFEAKDAKKLVSEYVKPLFEQYPQYHWIICKMDNDLTKAAKIWFNAWDAYTINQYPCIAIFLSGRSTLLEHTFFTNFESGKKKFDDLFADAVHLKYDKKICG